MRELHALAAIVLTGCAAAPSQVSVATQFALDHRLTVSEAERRLAHQDAIHALITRASADPTWGGLRVEHQPAYRIVLAFADGRPRPELLSEVPADLRPHIVFERAVRSRGEAERLMDLLSAALQPLGGDWNIAYDEAKGRFTVNVARKGQIERARALVPAAMRSEVDVVVGPQIIPT